MAAQQGVMHIAVSKPHPELCLLTVEPHVWFLTTLKEKKGQPASVIFCKLKVIVHTAECPGKARQ